MATWRLSSYFEARATRVVTSRCFQISPWHYPALLEGVQAHASDLTYESAARVPRSEASCDTHRIIRTSAYCTFWRSSLTGSRNLVKLSRHRPRLSKRAVRIEFGTTSDN